MNRLLQDKVFISTRPENKSEELAGLFANAGATLLEMPLIKIQGATLSESEKDYFNRLQNFHWLIFTSPNGVRYFFENLTAIQGNLKLPESVQIAVIGNKTEKALNEFGYLAAFKNPGSTGEDFADAFIQKISSNGNPNILLPLGNIARTVIQDRLAEFANCTRINVYDTTAANLVDSKILEQIENDNYEMLLFTSPSGIENFLNISTEIQTENIRIACIGETTSKTAIKNNIKPKVVAKNSTASGLFESIINYYTKQTIKKL
ncbi:MAG: uroporphyrinogen-III synthase [Bacteroidetes bacterium]|nr:uroporphyrinogen-III synthase [Bacteroidota bacterium]